MHGLQEGKEGYIVCFLVWFMEIELPYSTTIYSQPIKMSIFIGCSYSGNNRRCYNDYPRLSPSSHTRHSLVVEVVLVTLFGVQTGTLLETILLMRVGIKRI
jgi:hypothetical protein